MRKLLLVTALFLVALSSMFGAYLSFQPINAVQPDGTKLELYATGDEFYNWLHDKKGYTIKQNDKGWYVYLDKDANAELFFTELVVGRDNPEDSYIKPSTNISPEKMAAKRSARQKEMRDIGMNNARTTGTLNNIVIFIRFSDQTEFGQNLSTYSSMFNGTTGNNMQTYFAEASYNTLNITTSFYPTPTTTVVSWQDSHPRGYFSPYNATSNPIGYSGDTQRTSREHILLRDAVNGVSSMIPSGLNVDADGDNYVDNVCFIIKGTSDGWAELLWPHMWALYSETAYINGKRVWTFNFQLSDFMASSGNGVLSHEMFHSLGSPDLYHYYENVFSPVGGWDLMENNANPPQHMGAYMKWKYGGWIASIPTLTTDGTYYLNPLVSSTNNVYRINSPYSSTEYFVVEYRQKTGTFENSIPGTGMLIYRINTAYNGNADGPPDEVYIYRPNGTTTVNGSISLANYSSATGRTAINTTTNPTPFLTNGSAGGLNINTIGSAGSTISFVLGNPTTTAPTCTITAPTEGQVFNLNSTIPITATATDSDGTITNVKFYVDDVLKYTDSTSPYSWSWNSTGYSAGNHIIKAVATDNSALTGQSTVTVTLLAPANEGFETGNFSAYPWSQSGNLPWTVQTVDKYSGTYAAKSGAIGDSQTSTMSVTLNITSAGNIVFAQKVSSEVGYDFLKFYIDGAEQASWSGAGSWAYQTYPVSAGSRSFTWTYSKDANTIGGSDCAFLDHIIFPPHTVPTPANITWNPASFTQGLLANQTINQTLTIGNTGTSDLTYTAALPAGAITVLDETFATTTMPANWTETLVSGTALSWIYASGGYNGHPAAAYDGAYNARLYKASSTASVVKLNTPLLDLSGSASATLTFWHTQELWPSDQDELRVYYKTSLGGTWNILATYTASIVAWTQETISLPNPNATYYIAFEGTAKYGYGVCLDKVVVTKQTAPAVPWLTLNSGTSVSNIISGIGNNNITVGFNTAGMSAGTYNANITVTSNSAVNPTVQIPVTLNVTVPAAAIVVNPTSLAYGSVKVGTTTNNTFTISNTGSATLTGSITTPTGYSVVLAVRTADDSSERNSEIITKSSNDRNVLTYSVLGNSSSNFTLTFAPLAVQNYNGNVVISSNDPNNPTVNVAVTGAGFIPPTIGIDNTSLVVSLAIDANGTDSFTISNSGSQVLSFTIAESPAVAWFSPSLMSGNIPANGSQPVTGNFNADNLTPGNYQTTLLVNSNDPATPQVTLTVNMQVTNTAPIIDLPASFAFDMNGSLVVDCSPYVDDPDGQMLIADYSGNTNIHVLIDVPFVTFTAVPDWYGTENITFSVYDGYVYAYDTVAVTVNLTHLDVPEISTINLAPGNLALNWNAVPNATQYRIYRALEPNGTYTHIATTDQPFYQDTQVLDKAFYHVIAVNNPPAK